MKMDMADVIALVLQNADRLSKNAAYNGEMGDGGSAALRKEVLFYQLGQKGELPEAWKSYAQQLDPEWKEFQRLKEKFEG